MKKVLFILLCSFVSFAFTTNEKIEPISAEDNVEITSSKTEVKIYETEKGTITVVISDDGICQDGVVYLTFTVDCTGNGQPDYTYSGKVCAEHEGAMIMQFIASC